MDKDVTYKDLRQAYLHTVCMWDGDPVLVQGISTDRDFQIKNLKTNRSTIERFDHNKLKSPLGRLGMVNRNGLAYYIVRSTARVYQMGINSANIVATYFRHVPYARVGLDTIQMREVAISEVADTLMGNYPTFQEALETVKTFGGVVAFDRQFAIDEIRRVFYKSTCVGGAGSGCRTADEIQFHNDYKHLSCVIGEISNEKIVRSIRS